MKEEKDEMRPLKKWLAFIALKSQNCDYWLNADDEFKGNQSFTFRTEIPNI